MKRTPKRDLTLLCTLLAVPLALTAFTRDASAFCGFYVSGADTKLLAEASQVVLMRDGTRTVLSMQNDYKGPPEGFAMVVPVPVVLQKENVKTLPRDVFDRVDRLSSPRLVEYWEQDPCPKPGQMDGLGLSGIGMGGGGQGFGSGHGRLGGAGSVTIEAQFEVGEYEIVILSAQDAAGLESWLKQNGYKIPDNAEPVLRPYVQAGSKFFVAKVNVAKVKFEDGRATLSPLRFHYDSDKFELPVRLGMLSSPGTQDLIVNVLAPNKRYVVANYPSVTIPTNLDVSDKARGDFPSFYAALFDRTLEKNPGAIVTEYVWPSSSCDPCPGGVGGLSNVDLVTLGADVLPSTVTGPVNSGIGAATLRMGAVDVKGKLPPEVVSRIVRQNMGRYRLCYENALRNNPTLAGKIVTKVEIGPTGAVTSAKSEGSDLPDKGAEQCVVRGFQQLSFPEPGDNTKVTATIPITFTPPGGASPPPSGLGGGGRIGRVGISSVGSFVLTRLHARYTKNALGSDLVFKEAPPIVGGREFRNGPNAPLETGATPSTVSSFQARYAIRHEWKGAIECKEPRRGVWGAPWPDAGAPSAPPAAVARKLAYVPRGNVNLASFVTGGIPELGGAAVTSDLSNAGREAGALDPNADASASDAGTGDASTPDGGDGPSPSKSRCGCRVVGARFESSSVTTTLVLLGASAVVARRTRRLRRRRN